MSNRIVTGSGNGYDHRGRNGQGSRSYNIAAVIMFEGNYVKSILCQIKEQGDFLEEVRQSHQGSSIGATPGARSRPSHWQVLEVQIVNVGLQGVGI